MELPEKVLEKILLYSSVDTLKQLLNIKKFRPLILKNRKLMMKLPLIVIGKSWRKKLEALKNIGGFIVRLVITSQAMFCWLIEIVEILKLTPNLEVLVILKGADPPALITYNVYHDITLVEEEETVPEFLNLWKIEAKCSPNILWVLFKYLKKCDSLEELTIFAAGPHYHSTVPEFILKQKNLKHLKLFGERSVLFHKEVQIGKYKNVEFRLETLTMENQDLGRNEKITEFLKTQTELKKVIFMYSHVDFQHILAILENCKILEIFSFTCESMDTAELQRRKFKLKAVEDLTLDEKVDDPLLFSNLMEIFPNVKKLYTWKIAGFHFGFNEIANNLEHLRVNSVSLNAFLFVTFARLKTFETNYMLVESEEAVKDFFTRNQALEEIKINQILGVRTASTGKFYLKCILSNLNLLSNLKFFHLKSVFEIRGNPLGIRFENVENFSISVKIDKRNENRKIFQLDDGVVDNYLELVQSLYRTPLCKDCDLDRIDYHW